MKKSKLNTNNSIQPCPTCGVCPTCGRKDFTPLQPYQVPYTPVQPVIPWWQQPYVCSGTGIALLAGSTITTNTGGN